MTEFSSLVVRTNLWRIKDQLMSNKLERFCGRRLNGDFKLSRTINLDDPHASDAPEVERGMLMYQIVTSESFPAEDAAADLQSNRHTSPLITGAGCLYVRSYVHILSEAHLRYNITRGKLQSHTCEVFNQQPREESAAFGTWRQLLLTCWKAPLHVHFCPLMTWMICGNGSGSFRDGPCWQERQFLVLMEMPSSTTTSLPHSEEKPQKDHKHLQDLFSYNGKFPMVIFTWSTIHACDDKPNPEIDVH